MRQFITAVTLEAIGVPFCLSADGADTDGVKYDKAAVEAHLKKYIEKKTGLVPDREVLCGNSLYIALLTNALGEAQIKVNNEPPKDNFIKQGIEALFEDLRGLIPNELERSKLHVANKILNTSLPNAEMDEDFLHQVLRGAQMKELTRLLDFTGTHFTDGLKPYWPQCPAPLCWDELINRAPNEPYIQDELDQVYEVLLDFFENRLPKNFFNPMLERLIFLRAPSNDPDHVRIRPFTNIPIEKYSHSLHEAVSPYLCAKFSELAYLGELNIERINPPEGWTAIGRSALNKNSYYGIAFQKEDLVVIAHRGSDFKLTENILTDIGIACAEESSFQPPNSCIDALSFSYRIRKLYSRATHSFGIETEDDKPQLNFFDRIRDKVRSVFSARKPTQITPIITRTYTFIETGHSLGGFYAEINSYIFNGKSITYDSPGTSELLSSQVFKQAWKNIASMKLKIPIQSIPDVISEEDYISFISSPNIVNTAFRHIGNNVFRLYSYHIAGAGLSVNEISEAITNVTKLVSSLLINPLAIIPWAGNLMVKFIEREALSHSLNQMIECLDPVSGEPYLARRVVSWPNRTQYRNEGIATWRRCKSFAEGFIGNTSTANLAYEQLCDKIPGHEEGAFIVPALDASADSIKFEDAMVTRFDEFYKGDRFLNRLREAVRRDQGVV
jgi:hypothetical protein